MKWRYSRDDKFRKKFYIGRVKIVPGYTFFVFYRKAVPFGRRPSKKKTENVICFCSFVHLST